jgi:hypothetical protein
VKIKNQLEGSAYSHVQRRRQDLVMIGNALDCVQATMRVSPALYSYPTQNMLVRLRLFSG